MVPNLQPTTAPLTLLTSTSSTRHPARRPDTTTASNTREPITTKLWSANSQAADVGGVGGPENDISSIAISRNFATTAAGAIGPTALLVGGTAAMYTSLLNHPSSTLTPLSILYMLLLAIQTSIQPRLSRKYIPKRVSKVKVALVEEVIKTSVASVLFWKWTNPTIVQEALKDWTLSSSLLVAGIPATLYAIQGVLTYLSHQHLDSVTFNGLSQTKTLTAALCCYMVMGKRQSPLQVIALGLLFVSAFVFQNVPIALQLKWNGENNKKDEAKQQEQEAITASNPQTSTPPTATPSTDLSHADRAFLLYGVAPCLGATFLSGLAGAFSQRGLQIVGGSGRNAFLYTVEVSFFSALALLFSQGLSMLKKKKSNTKTDDSKEVEETTGWSWQTYIPIACKATGGILTALVHKHAGSVVKGFALMLGLVMSGILQSLWLEDNNTNGNGKSTLPTNQVLGIIIVMFSSWLHFTNPPS